MTLNSTSVRINQENYDYCRSKLRDYGIGTFGEFVNGLCYLIRFNDETDKCRIKSFIENVLSGDTILNDGAYQELQIRQQIKDVFFETLEEMPNLFLDITRGGINQFIKNTRWMEAVTEIVEDKVGVAVFPIDAKDMVKKWYQYMLDSGKGRKIYTEYKMRGKNDNSN